MPLKYWRTMLIASALGVCGLAVWANDKTPNKLPMPSPESVVPLPAPATDAAKDDPFPGTKAAEPSPEPIKVLELAGNPPPAGSLPVAPPVVPPPVLPTKADVPSLDFPSEPPKVVKPTPPPTLDPLPLPGARARPALPSNDPPPLPKAALDLPTSPKVTPPPGPGELDLPRDEPKYIPIPNTPARPTPIMPVATNPVASTPALAPAAYKLHVRMGGNLGPRFEVRDGDSLLLKVYCDHIDMQGTKGATTIPGLTATGRVRVAGSGVSGTCDSLTIVSAKGEVKLQGNVKLTCYRGNASSEISGESMSFQLKGTTTTESPTKAKSNPTSH